MPPMSAGRLTGNLQAMATGVNKIGLISDTHGLLRKEGTRSPARSELIIHAGDVGKPEILEELRKIAPVIAVRGNVDKERWAQALPDTAVAEASAVLIYVLHDVKTLDLNPTAAGFHIVVSGHSHKPGKTERDGGVHQSRKRWPAKIPAASDSGTVESEPNPL